MMINVYRISTKQHGGMKSAISDPKARPSPKHCLLVHCLAGNVKVKLSLQVRESDHFGHFFMVTMVKLQQFVISERDELHH